VSTLAPVRESEEIIYPDSDGQPMADNTLQFEWIVTVQGNLDALFRDNPDVFVGGDLLWYPVEGQPGVRVAPDVLVAFGRPKGYRGSYQQWKEGGVAPQVVWEILSPGNRPIEMLRKSYFYREHGVEEFYVYDPELGECYGYVRSGEEWREIATFHGWVSPRLGVRFEIDEEGLHLFRPDGTPFAPFTEVIRQRDEERAARERETERAERERQRAEQERERAEQERERAEQERERADRLLAQLRALGAEPEA